MTQIDVLRQVLSTVEVLDIAYMLTGAMAVNFYGRPRMTHDIDIVVQVRREHVKDITQRLEADFYIAKEGIEDAITHKTMFNAIHHETGMKVDFWQVSEDAYDYERFSRRVARDALETKMFFPAPEDVIVTKLDWYRQSELTKHLDDAVGIWQVQRGHLDEAYLTKWCERLSLVDLLAEVRRRATL